MLYYLKRLFVLKKHCCKKKNKILCQYSQYLHHEVFLGIYHMLTLVPSPLS